MIFFWSNLPQKDTVCNFQSMKSSVDLNSLFIKILLLYHLVCYITWLDATLEDTQTRPLRQITNCVFPIKNGKTALLYASMAVTYYVKLFRTGTDRHYGILMSFLLLVAETMLKNAIIIQIFYILKRYWACI